MRKILMLVISLVFLLLNGLLAYQFISYETIALNYKYLIVGGFALIIILITLCYVRFQFKRIKNSMSHSQKKKMKFKRLASSLLMIILCISIGLVNTYYYSLNHLMDSITDYTIEEEEKTKCNVYAKKDSSISDLSDLNIKKIGVLSRENGIIKSPLKQLLKKQYSYQPDVYSYPTSVDLYGGLMDKQMDLIVISENEVNTMLEYATDFEKNTKLICQIELGTAVESKPVDVTSECFNVLILGVDIREKEGTIRTDTRTDTIMVASFNPRTMDVALISVPRDGYVNINGDFDKMTHAGNSGLATVVSTVEELLDIEINYFAKFNFSALVKVIDAIGGIDITVDYSFCEQDSKDTPNAICLNEGYQHLDGEQALAYARHRKTVGDAMRNKAQQQVIKGITNKLVSFSLLTKFDNLTNVLASNMLTNFTRKELYSLASLAPNLGNLNYHNMVITGTDDSAYIKKYSSRMSIIRMDESSINEAHNLINEIHNKIPE